VSWHHRGCPDATATKAPIELHGEQCGGRLRPAIGYPGIIGLPLETRIVQVNVGDTVSLRRHDHQASAIEDQRFDAMDQGEMTKVIDPELEFETIDGSCERRRHDPGICDDDVEWPSVCQ